MFHSNSSFLLFLQSLQEPVKVPEGSVMWWQMVKSNSWIIDWNQNSCGTGVEWKLLSTLIAPRPLTRFFLGSPVLRVTERWWTPQHTLSVPIIKAQRDCQSNAPHNNWLHKFRRLKQHFRPCRLIAVSVQLSYRETFFFPVTVCPLTCGDSWGQCRLCDSGENMQMCRDGVYHPELLCSMTAQ